MQQARRQHLLAGQGCTMLMCTGDLEMAEDGAVLRQHGAIFADKWSAGERRVRQVMLGHPNASTLAGLPPAWVRCATQWARGCAMSRSYALYQQSGSYSATVKWQQPRPSAGAARAAMLHVHPFNSSTPLAAEQAVNTSAL